MDCAINAYNNVTFGGIIGMNHLDPARPIGHYGATIPTESQKNAQAFAVGCEWDGHSPVTKADFAHALNLKTVDASKGIKRRRKRSLIHMQTLMEQGDPAERSRTEEVLYWRLLCGDKLIAYDGAADGGGGGGGGGYACGDGRAGGRAWQCKACGAAFPTSAALRAHRTSAHAPRRPHACPTCGATFARSDTLRAHARVHTGERPFLCERCGAAFTHAAHLRQHARAHAAAEAERADRPHRCAHCCAAFAQLAYLRRHERVHAAATDGNAYATSAAPGHGEGPSSFGLQPDTSALAMQVESRTSAFGESGVFSAFGAPAGPSTFVVQPDSSTLDMAGSSMFVENPVTVSCGVQAGSSTFGIQAACSRGVQTDARTFGLAGALRTVGVQTGSSKHALQAGTKTSGTQTKPSTFFSQVWTTTVSTQTRSCTLGTQTGTTTFATQTDLSTVVTQSASNTFSRNSESLNTPSGTSPIHAQPGPSKYRTPTGLNNLGTPTRSSTFGIPAMSSTFGAQTGSMISSAHSYSTTSESGNNSTSNIGDAISNNVEKHVITCGTPATRSPDRVHTKSETENAQTKGKQGSKGKNNANAVSNGFNAHDTYNVSNYELDLRAAPGANTVNSVFSTVGAQPPLYTLPSKTNSSTSKKKTLVSTPMAPTIGQFGGQESMPPTVQTFIAGAKTNTSPKISPFALNESQIYNCQSTIQEPHGSKAIPNTISNISDKKTPVSTSFPPAIISQFGGQGSMPPTYQTFINELKIDTSPKNSPFALNASQSCSCQSTTQEPQGNKCIPNAMSSVSNNKPPLTTPTAPAIVSQFDEQVPKTPTFHSFIAGRRTNTAPKNLPLAPNESQSYNSPSTTPEPREIKAIPNTISSTNNKRISTAPTIINQFEEQGLKAFQTFNCGGKTNTSPKNSPLVPNETQSYTSQSTGQESQGSKVIPNSIPSTSKNKTLLTTPTTPAVGQLNGQGVKPPSFQTIAGRRTNTPPKKSPIAHKDAQRNPCQSTDQESHGSKAISNTDTRQGVNLQLKPSHSVGLCANYANIATDTTHKNIKDPPVVPQHGTDLDQGKRRVIRVQVTSPPTSGCSPPKRHAVFIPACQNSCPYRAEGPQEQNSLLKGTSVAGSARAQALSPAVRQPPPHAYCGDFTPMATPTGHKLGVSSSVTSSTFSTAANPNCGRLADVRAFETQHSNHVTASGRSILLTQTTTPSPGPPSPFNSDLPSMAVCPNMNPEATVHRNYASTTGKSTYRKLLPKPPAVGTHQAIMTQPAARARRRHPAPGPTQPPPPAATGPSTSPGPAPGPTPTPSRGHCHQGDRRAPGHSHAHTHSHQVEGSGGCGSCGVTMLSEVTPSTAPATTFSFRVVETANVSEVVPIAPTSREATWCKAGIHIPSTVRSPFQKMIIPPESPPNKAINFQYRM